MSSEIIKLSKISKRFVQSNKDIVVLKNINLKIKKGELISLTGPSGSGKSTLLKVLSGISSFKSGKISFNNIDLQDDHYNKKLKVLEGPKVVKTFK